MELQTVLGKVSEILKAEFPVLASVDLTAETALLSSGFLDSFAIVTLVASLENEYGFELDVENMELEQFETPLSIAELCKAALE